MAVGSCFTFASDPLRISSLSHIDHLAASFSLKTPMALLPRPDSTSPSRALQPGCFLMPCIVCASNSETVGLNLLKDVCFSVPCRHTILWLAPEATQPRLKESIKPQFSRECIRSSFAAHHDQETYPSTSAHFPWPATRASPAHLRGDAQASTSGPYIAPLCMQEDIS
jgi:hypothetical protein